MIPKILHQTWKTAAPPERWRPCIERNKALHPDWEYRLLVDSEVEPFIAEHVPELLELFRDLPLDIMRYDVLRYVMMHALGGVYLDLDYELTQPLELADGFVESKLVLPRSRSIAEGDARDVLGNCFFASAAGHPFWRAVFDDLLANPPRSNRQEDVFEMTGPWFITRVFFAHQDKFPDVSLPRRRMFHPPTPTSRGAYQRLLADPEVHGIHHCAGSWNDGSIVVKVKRRIRSWATQA